MSVKAYASLQRLWALDGVYALVAFGSRGRGEAQPESDLDLAVILWPTPDGSGVRDYIHVMDLAEGHLAALETLRIEEPQLLTANLGSDQGHSVLEMVAAFAQASGRPVPHHLVNRRAGDAACSLADPAFAASRLG